MIEVICFAPVLFVVKFQNFEKTLYLREIMLENSLKIKTLIEKYVMYVIITIYITDSAMWIVFISLRLHFVICKGIYLKAFFKL